MVAEGTFPKANGDILFATEANAFAVVGSIYQGTDFDSASSTTTEVSGTYTFDVTAGGLKNKYVLINIYGISAFGGAASTATTSAILIETASSGASPSYSASLAKHNIGATGRGAQDTTSVTMPVNINWIHPLTAAEKVSGLSIRLVSFSTGAASANANFTNKQASYALVNGSGS